MSDNNKGTKKTNILLSSMFKINQKLLVANNEKILCQKICRYLTSTMGYKLVWIGLKENNNKIAPQAISGSDNDLVITIKSYWGKYEFNNHPSGLVLKNGKPYLIENLEDGNSFIPWDKEVSKRGFISAIILPVIIKNETIGSLHVYSDIKEYFAKDEFRFLNTVVGDISIAISNLRNEKKILEDKIEYEELFKRISSCVAIYEVKNNGADFIFKDMNEAAEKAERIKKGDLVGKSVITAFPRVKEYGLLDIFRRVYKTGRPVHHPVSLYKDNRIAGWRENFVYKLPNGNIVTVYDDLTEKKQYEEKINDLARFSQENPNPVIRVDYTGKIIYCNQACCKRDKKNTKPCVYLPVKLRNAVREIKNQKSYNPRIVEKRIGSKHYSYNIVPVKDRGYINLYGTDITKIKDLEEFISVSEKKYRKLFDFAPIGLAVIDKNGIITSVNKEIANLCRLNKKNLLGKHFTELKIINQDSVPELLHIFSDILDGVTTRPIYSNWCDTAGLNKTGEIKINLLKDKGKVTGILLVVRDITDNILAEQNLKDSLKKVNKTLDDTIETLSIMVESKDPYTAGHQAGVARLSVAIAEKLKLDKNIIDYIGKAATIHDIGKISIPQSLLSKPTILTDLEKALIQTHSRSGYDIIKNIDFGYPIAEIVLQHHEREDGSGYPKGLKSKDIMLEAKIIAVADVVEAMCTHRPYRPAYKVREAIYEIKSNKNKLYDTRIVNACIKVLKENTFWFCDDEK